MAPSAKSLAASWSVLAAEEVAHAAEGPRTLVGRQHGALGGAGVVVGHAAAHAAVGETTCNKDDVLVVPERAHRLLCHWLGLTVREARRGHSPAATAVGQAGRGQEQAAQGGHHEQLRQSKTTRTHGQGGQGTGRQGWGEGLAGQAARPTPSTRRPPICLDGDREAEAKADRGR